MYVEATYDVKHRSNLINEEKLSKYVIEAQEQNKELYSSYYKFDIDALEHLKTHKTLRGFNGIVHPPRLIKFDIDKGKDTDAFVLHRAKVFWEKLTEEWKLSEENIGIFFSGTGFHFYIPDIFGFKPSKNLQIIVKNTLTKYFPEADDIYDKTRIFRVINTVNKKSGLYKVQLSTEELLHSNIEQIHRLAKEPRSLSVGLEPVEPLYESFIVNELPKNTGLVANNFTNIVTCMQHLYHRGPVKGRRHTDLMRLISAWRRQGLSKEATLDLAVAWAKTLEPSEVKKLVNDIFDKGYTYGCNDSVYKEFCDEHCMFYKHKNYEPETLTTETIEKKYKSFVTEDMQDKILNIKDAYPYKDFKFYPGELVIVTGDSGTGKSAWIQNLNIKWQVPTLYLSLEMHDLLVYRRFIQIAYGMTREDVEEYYRKEHFKSLTGVIDHIKILTTPPTLESIERLVENTMPRLVVIDVIDGIVVKGKDDNSKMGEIINFLKGLADKLGIIIIAVHHINKSSAVEGKITMHSLKGASTVYQKADKVLAILGDKNTVFRKIVTLKARDEEPFETFLKWDTSTFKFYEVKS